MPASCRSASSVQPGSVSTSTGSFAADEALLGRARALGAIIREHAETAERERRLARPVLER